MINPNLRPLRLAVLGNPVAHSLSPVIQEAALDSAGIDGAYIRREVDEEGMAGAAEEIRKGRLDGANVTMPHKALAARLADVRSEVVRRCGGANTLWSEGGRLRAHTTDPDGVRFAWAHAGLPEGGPVLLLGAGGAAAAALAALDERTCTVSARREEAARALVDQVSPAATVIPWGASVPGAVVVNATPLGLAAGTLPHPVIEDAQGLLEMNYGGGVTAASALVRSRGLPVADGELMLVGQAVASFAIWTGIEVPPAVMFTALDRWKAEHSVDGR